MLLELEQSVAAQYLAILPLDASPTERAAAVSAAKVTIARAARFIGQNAVQLHGGMGMTEDGHRALPSASPRSSTNSAPPTLIWKRQFTRATAPAR